MTVQQRRSTPGLTSALILIVLILVGVLYGGRIKADVQKLTKDRADKEIELDKADQELKSFEKLASSLPDTESGKMKLLSAIPTYLNEDELINEMDKLTKKSNISFDSINFDISSAQAKEGEDMSKVRIYSTFKGTYNDLLSFLQAVESDTRKITIRSISISFEEAPATENQDQNKSAKPTATPPPATQTPLLTSFNVNMEAYYQGLIK